MRLNQLMQGQSQTAGPGAQTPQGQGAALSQGLNAQQMQQQTQQVQILYN